jgi:hypothetical protein
MSGSQCRDGIQGLRAVAQNTGASLLDFWLVVRPEDTYLPLRENRATYRDAGHLSVFGSAMLAASFEAALVCETYLSRRRRAATYRRSGGRIIELAPI